MLRGTYGERVQTMLEFVKEEDECRSQFLLRYFGQEKSRPCGKCDICRSGSAQTKELGTQIKAWIEARGGKYSLAEARAAFGQADENWLGVLRELIDRKDVPSYT